jgi:hypothetical protein
MQSDTVSTPPIMIPPSHETSRDDEAPRGGRFVSVKGRTPLML